MEPYLKPGNLASLESALQAHLDSFSHLKSLLPQVGDAADLLTRALEAGHKVLLCGNGGSAADAQHLAAEFLGRFMRERRPLPALALHANSSAVTAIGNDYSYDEIFSRPLRALGSRGDVLIAISTSGNSRNVLAAARVASEMGITVIGLTGETGGQLRDLCQICLAVPSSDTARIQEMHIFLGHALCSLAEMAIAPDAPSAVPVGG